MKRISAKRSAVTAVKLAGAVALAATVGVGPAFADDHTPNWQRGAYEHHPQARVYQYHAPPARYYNYRHGYYDGYRYRGPYYTYAPPPVIYDPYPSSGVSLFFSF